MFGLSATEVTTLVTALVTLLGGWAGYRRLRIETRDTMVANFQALIDEQRKELDRIIAQRQARENQLQAEIDRLNAAIIAAKKERERQLGAMAQAHSVEIQQLKDRCREEAGQLKEQIQGYQETTYRQTQRIRNLERQLGIEPTGVHNDRIHQSSDRITGPDRRIVPEKRKVAGRGEDRADASDQSDPGNPDDLGRGSD